MRLPSWRKLPNRSSSGMAEMTNNTSKPDAAASLYVGDVMHARLKPFVHRFQYQVMSLLIDLDRLTDADRQSTLFGVNRSALYSFHESDHGRRDGSSLRAYAEASARVHDIDLNGGKVLLLCYPRLLGYAFNPLSVYFCTDSAGALALVIYEVRNTLREIHHYVLPVSANESYAPVVHQEQDKTFQVSPFIDMAMRYYFRVCPPGETVKIRILETDAKGPLLAATFSGKRRPLTSAALAKTFVALPFVTVKIIAAIHWQALRLWLKGAKLVPGAPSEVNDHLPKEAGSGSNALAH
jgi:DUF1365 family protein